MTSGLTLLPFAVDASAGGTPGLLLFMESAPHRNTMHRWIIFLGLMVAWVVFSGLLDLFHLTLGVISCGLVTWLSEDLLFARRDTTLRRRLRQGRRMVWYLLWLLWQVVLANIHLLRLSFSPRSALQPQIVRYETKLETDFEKFLLANSITLTPGTVTMKILGNNLYIHAISDFAADGLNGPMESHIAHIFSEPEA